MKILPYDGLTLSEAQLKVLRYMFDRSGGYSGENAWYFRTIEKGTKLDRRMVRIACRALARKGLTEHIRGLVYEYGPNEGMLAGSGYGITALGVQVMERMEEYEEAQKTKL